MLCIHSAKKRKFWGAFLAVAFLCVSDWSISVRAAEADSPTVYEVEAFNIEFSSGGAGSCLPENFISREDVIDLMTEAYGVQQEVGGTSRHVDVTISLIGLEQELSNECVFFGHMLATIDIDESLNRDGIRNWDSLSIVHINASLFQVPVEEFEDTVASFLEENIDQLGSKISIEPRVGR